MTSTTAEATVLIGVVLSRPGLVHKACSSSSGMHDERVVGRIVDTFDDICGQVLDKSTQV